MVDVVRRKQAVTGEETVLFPVTHTLLRQRGEQLILRTEGEHQEINELPPVPAAVPARRAVRRRGAATYGQSR